MGERRSPRVVALPPRSPWVDGKGRLPPDECSVTEPCPGRPREIERGIERVARGEGAVLPEARSNCTCHAWTTDVTQQHPVAVQLRKLSSRMP